MHQKKLKLYLQKTMEYLSGLMNQRAMLCLAIGGVSICLMLIILGFIFPQGIPTDNQNVSDDPDTIVETYAGITSEYTASQAIDFVKSAIQSDNLGNPRCNTEQGEFVAFFSHRKYWKVAFSCPPDVSEGVHVRTEYTYEFNEWDETVKNTTLQ